MDTVLEIFDYLFLDRLYAAAFPKDGQVAASVTQFMNAHKSPFDTFSTVNSTMVLTNSVPFPLQAAAKMFGSLRNNNEVYGKVPGYLPYSNLADASFLSRSNIVRQALSLLVITTIFGWLLYLIVATLSYIFVFDKNIFNHPRYLKNQMSLEIERAMTAIPIMVSLTLPFFLLELKGYSRLYMEVNESTGGWKALVFQIPAFILFTDCGIYFIHRILHWPSVYKKLHKPHHKWIVCTPFASHAFHPVDGWAQSIPYHIYPLIFPLHKVSYILLFTFVNFWTVMIHDGQYLSNDPVVNGTACHTVHHLYFNYNYGQFTTLWDRLGGSYRRPDDSLFVKQDVAEEKKLWESQTQGMEEIRGKLEGNDDFREYI
ncbi:uncharacterized protein PRCAT00004536001 [Priceomyces carsonii]|uniref:uncharacterized protein n=1 Tax=Priceomyces carsonii TaxID=28549 RepID=UPI002EDA62A2|nr:unnamed protein product [Priceomyces carsonii]